jgi:hypothetical protein
MNWLDNFKPGLPKGWLQVLAGLVWTCVGLYLISLALEWVFAKGVDFPWLYIIAGLMLASLIYAYGFLKLALKNSQRINDLEAERPCLFAFQEWHSYPLVLVMIGLGIGLRKFTPIPKPLLGILYLGIGGGLAGASIHYYFQVNKDTTTVD